MKTRAPKIEAHSKLLLSALAAALIAISPVQTWANTIALSFTTVTNPGGISPVTSGWSFSLTTAVTVTDLGVWDGAAGVTTETGGGDGLSDSHFVTIWTSTMVQVAQATVPAASGATLTDGFRYV